MDWFEHLTQGIDFIGELLTIVLEGISVCCVGAGLFSTSQMLFRKPTKLSIVPFLTIRVRFGYWLALALEFQLASDILSTTIAPSFNELAKLAIIAAIRTFLNYFLNKELEAEMELQKKKSQNKQINLQ